jgi:hypothetical protein
VKEILKVTEDHDGGGSNTMRLNFSYLERRGLRGHHPSTDRYII